MVRIRVLAMRETRNGSSRAVGRVVGEEGEPMWEGGKEEGRELSLRRHIAAPPLDRYESYRRFHWKLEAQESGMRGTRGLVGGEYWLGQRLVSQRLVWVVEGRLQSEVNWK